MVGHSRTLARLLVAVFLLVSGSGCELTWDDSEDFFRSSRYDGEDEEDLLDLDEPSVDSPKAEALRARAQKAFDERKFEKAVEILHTLQDDFDNTRAAKEARTYFLIAEGYFHLGDYERAHDYYMKTLRRGPGETIFNQTLNRIYNVGLAFLHGRAERSLLGFSFTSPTYGVDILIGEKGLLTRFPLSRYSAAIWEIAEFYYNKKQFSDAERVYEQLVREFSDSEWAEQAEYKLALSVFNQVRGVAYDQDPLRKAKRKFLAYRAHYPRGNYSEQVRNSLREIAEMQAQHDLTVAKYYLRESRPQAARFYLRSVLLNNPKTDAAREARPMFQELSKYDAGQRAQLPREEPDGEGK